MNSTVVEIDRLELPLDLRVYLLMKEIVDLAQLATDEELGYITYRLTQMTNDLVYRASRAGK